MLPWGKVDTPPQPKVARGKPSHGGVIYISWERIPFCCGRTPIKMH
jgi:hypothetical protein